METSQERADDFANRLGKAVAGQLDAFISSKKPTDKVQAAQAGKADKRETEVRRHEVTLADKLPANARGKGRS
jgi:hypothetical protein